MVERASAGYDRSAYRLFSVNLENEEIEDALAKRNLLGWIDQKTQQEVARIMHVGQQAVSKGERGILKEIKKFFK